MGCSTLYFCTLQVVVSLFGINFLQECMYIYFIWSCTSLWQDLKRLRKYHRLEVQLAYFNRLCPIFTTVCFEFYFLEFHLVLHYIRITFFMNIFLLLGRVSLDSRQDLRWLRKFYRLEVLHAFKMNLAHFIYFLTYGKTSPDSETRHQCSQPVGFRHNPGSVSYFSSCKLLFLVHHAMSFKFGRANRYLVLIHQRFEIPRKYVVQWPLLPS